MEEISFSPRSEKTCLIENTDYRPVALTSNVVKSLERFMTDELRRARQGVLTASCAEMKSFSLRVQRAQAAGDSLGGFRQNGREDNGDVCS